MPSSLRTLASSARERTTLPRLPRRRAAIVCVLATVLLAPSMARADYVVLVAGDIITGKVIRKTKDEVAIRLTIGGLMTFKLEQVVKIRRGDVTLGNGEQGPLPKECDLSAVADESEPQRRQPPAGSGPTPGPSPPPPPAPLGSAANPSENTEPAPPAGPQALDPAGAPSRDPCRLQSSTPRTSSRTESGSTPWRRPWDSCAGRKAKLRPSSSR
jgi:hypothetical protein